MSLAVRVSTKSAAPRGSNPDALADSMAAVAGPDVALAP
jgi:hypothetical protein